MASVSPLPAQPEARPATVLAGGLRLPFAGQRYHLVGIGGSGMCGLAEMLMNKGAVVSGSDRVDGGALARLRNRGATIHIGQRPENVPDDAHVVVASAAVSDENPEIRRARERRVEIVKYAAALGRLMKSYKGIAVAGTHGKSTTTAMTAYTLRQAGLEPSFIVGAQVDQLGGGSGVGDGDFFVAEACEYDRSFLNLHPYYATILNVEEDHLDCFIDLHAITEAFRAFASLVPADGVIIANGEDRNVARAVAGVQALVQTFGRAEGNTWRATNLVSRRGQYSFDIQLAGRHVARATMYLPGLHNVYNALACWALCHHAGVPTDCLLDSLATFKGARRRMTVKGRAMGVTVVDDYAHHPTEITATLKAARDYFTPKRLICIFQPHQHSRTRFLLNDFARCFTSADLVLVPDIYFVRDSAEMRDAVNSRDLVARVNQHGGQAEYFPSFEAINQHLREQLRDGDLVVTMGAGNIYEVADATCEWLGCSPA